MDYADDQTSAERNPHPTGSVRAGAWDVDRALRRETEPLWDWLSSRSPRQHGMLIGTAFLGLVVLAIVSGSPVPVGLGVVAWFVGAYLIAH